MLTILITKKSASFHEAFSKIHILTKRRLWSYQNTFTMHFLNWVWCFTKHSEVKVRLNNTQLTQQQTYRRASDKKPGYRGLWQEERKKKKMEGIHFWEVWWWEGVAGSGKKKRGFKSLLNQEIKKKMKHTQMPSHFPSQASSLCLAAKRFCSLASCSFFFSASRCSFVRLLFTPRAPITSFRASAALV